MRPSPRRLPPGRSPSRPRRARRALRWRELQPRCGGVGRPLSPAFSRRRRPRWRRRRRDCARVGKRARRQEAPRAPAFLEKHREEDALPRLTAACFAEARRRPTLTAEAHCSLLCRGLSPPETHCRGSLQPALPRLVAAVALPRLTAAAELIAARRGSLRTARRGSLPRLAAGCFAEAHRRAPKLAAEAHCSLRCGLCCRGSKPQPSLSRHSEAHCRSSLSHAEAHCRGSAQPVLPRLIAARRNSLPTLTAACFAEVRRRSPRAEAHQERLGEAARCTPRLTAEARGRLFCRGS